MVVPHEEEKFRNAAKEIKERHDLGQPVLVGTISVEKSEKLAGILKKMGVKLEVLNAKNHEREATIVAQAGRKGAVTVSTNMAGRGTDILLGGNPEVQARESLRKQNIDPEQMPRTSGRRRWRSSKRRRTAIMKRWSHWAACTSWPPSGTNRGASTTSCAAAAGRQGDPGSSRFYLSPAGRPAPHLRRERMQNLMLRLGMEEDMPIDPSSSPSALQPRKRRSRRKTSSRANTCSNTTTS